jgi:methylmalonyl-CoA mutase N-terminal domain/subunit
VNQLEQTQAVEQKTQSLVGVNCFETDIGETPIEGFQGSEKVYERALERLEAVRRTRDARRARDAIRKLEEICRNPDENVMPFMLEALDAEVTLGEVGTVFRDTFGNWEAPVRI